MSYKDAEVIISFYKRLKDGGFKYVSRSDHDTVFEILEDNTAIKLTHEARLELSFERGGNYFVKKFVIPEGYVFDGASIPPVFWSLIGEPDDPQFLVAALAHDFLYEKRYNRQLSDQTFRRFLIEEGVWGFKAWLMWSAVRIGGFSFYAGDTNPFWKKVRNYLD